MCHGYLENGERQILIDEYFKAHMMDLSHKLGLNGLRG